MKIEVAYAGIKKTFFEGIKSHLKRKDIVFTKLPEDNYDKILANQTKGIIIIGNEVNHPIRLAQKAYSLDNSLSILIISEPDHYKKLKNALLFTPFIGGSVTCICENDAQVLANTIEDLITKTIQRRNFQSIKKLEIPAHSSPKIEQLKKEYVNKFFEKAPIGAILLDAHSNILGLNYHASNVLQDKETELLGNVLYNFFPDTIRNEIRQFLDFGYKTNSKQSFIKNQSPEEYVELAISEVKIQSDFIYKIAIVEDITEKVVKDRQIQQQIEELKKINTDLDNFVYTASHDLKAPISNIEGLINTLKEIQGPDQSNEELQILDLLEKSVLRFKATIQDLADIAKTQRNLDEDIDNVNIKDTIDDVLESLSKEINAVDGDIKVDYNDCSFIRMSKGQFKSIIFNLISNSVKYISPDRKPLIEVTCQALEGFTMVEVKDNGLGVSRSNQSKMFSMFKRFHDHVEGSGIGLYIVKRILDNTGGKIEVESEPNKGTTIKVYFKGDKDQSESIP